MRSKKAQLWPLYFVFITIFMCGFAVYLYSYQTDKLTGSLVSPKAILELRDNQAVFESIEHNAFIESAKVVNDSGKWGKGNEDYFKQIFLGKIVASSGNYLQTYLGLASASLGGIYSISFSKDSRGDIITFTRSDLTRTFKLFADDRSKINFPVGVSYTFGKTESAPRINK
jgi:hypothetical protein